MCIKSKGTVLEWQRTALRARNRVPVDREKLTRRKRLRSCVKRWMTTSGLSEVVDWLIEYVEDNNLSNDGASWSDWFSASDIIDAYEPALDERGKLTSFDHHDEYNVCQHLYVGERGHEILEACIVGADPQPLMRDWLDEIYDNGHKKPAAQA